MHSMFGYYATYIRRNDVNQPDSSYKDKSRSKRSCIKNLISIKSFLTSDKENKCDYRDRHVLLQRQTPHDQSTRWTRRAKCGSSPTSSSFRIQTSLVPGWALYTGKYGCDLFSWLGFPCIRGYSNKYLMVNIYVVNILCLYILNYCVWCHSMLLLHKKIIV